jgi:rod shape-determining protein MreD
VRWSRFLLIAVLAVLVQVTLMRVAGRQGSRPDLPAAVLVAFALGLRPGEGFLAGLILGFGRDLFTTQAFGLATGGFALLGFGLGWVRATGYTDHPAAHAVLGFLAAVLFSGASVLVAGMHGSGPAVGSVAGMTWRMALGTAVLAVALTWWVHRRARWFGLRRRVEFGHV